MQNLVFLCNAVGVSLGLECLGKALRAKTKRLKFSRPPVSPYSQAAVKRTTGREPQTLKTKGNQGSGREPQTLKSEDNPGYRKKI